MFTVLPLSLTLRASSGTLCWLFSRIYTWACAGGVKVITHEDKHSKFSFSQRSAILQNPNRVKMFYIFSPKRLKVLLTVNGNILDRLQWSAKYCLKRAEITWHTPATDILKCTSGPPAVIFNKFHHLWVSCSGGSKGAGDFLATAAHNLKPLTEERRD